jgi:hypothetical protein
VHWLRDGRYIDTFSIFSFSIQITFFTNRRIVGTWTAALSSRHDTALAWGVEFSNDSQWETYAWNTYGQGDAHVFLTAQARLEVDGAKAMACGWCFFNSRYTLLLS